MLWATISFWEEHFSFSKIGFIIIGKTLPWFLRWAWNMARYVSSCAAVNLKDLHCYVITMSRGIAWELFTNTPPWIIILFLFACNWGRTLITLELQFVSVILFFFFFVWKCWCYQAKIFVKVLTHFFDYFWKTVFQFGNHTSYRNCEIVKSEWQWSWPMEAIHSCVLRSFIYFSFSSLFLKDFRLSFWLVELLMVQICYWILSPGGDNSKKFKGSVT